MSTEAELREGHVHPLVFCRDGSVTMSSRDLVVLYTGYVAKLHYAMASHGVRLPTSDHMGRLITLVFRATSILEMCRLFRMYLTDDLRPSRRRLGMASSMIGTLMPPLLSDALDSGISFPLDQPHGLDITYDMEGALYVGEMTMIDALALMIEHCIKYPSLCSPSLQLRVRDMAYRYDSHIDSMVLETGKRVARAAGLIDSITHDHATFFSS